MQGASADPFYIFKFAKYVLVVLSVKYFCLAIVIFHGFGNPIYFCSANPCYSVFAAAYVTINDTGRVVSKQLGFLPGRFLN